MSLPENTMLADVLRVLRDRNPDLLSMLEADSDDQFLEATEKAIERDALRERMDGERPHRQTTAAVDHFIRGAFVTEHNHSSGTRVQILHLGCNLHCSNGA